MNLYQISEQYKCELEALFYDQDTGEVNETSLAKINSMQSDFNDKCIAVASFIKNIEAERDMVNKAKKEISDRESRLNREVEWLENYLLTNMKKCGITEIKSSPYFLIKVKKCPFSINIEDESLIPKEFFKAKEILSVDKAKIKEELHKGIFIPGASLHQNLRLEIK